MSETESDAVLPTDQDEREMRHMAYVRRVQKAKLSDALQRAFEDGVIRVLHIADEEWERARAEEEPEL